jgi:lysine-ketoglutarate reductase/saccharopine dehydrogenase-like protein (TIGR00300 family)
MNYKIKDLKPNISNPTEVTLGRVTKNGCFPKGAYLTSNLVEFYRKDGEWQLPLFPRMDGVARLNSENRLSIVEMNKLVEGDQVVLATTEDGSEGVFVSKFPKCNEKSGNFCFMTNNVSRERRVDYPFLAKEIKAAKQDNGNIIWVLGPAVIHCGGIENMEWLIENGYVGTILAGNAIGVHDIEHSLFNTSLGIDDDKGAVHNGHRKHLEAINMVRECGSIKASVEEGIVTHGIMYQCVKNNVPFVLAGSIRDDGPLPDTITDNLESQNKMRTQTKKASALITIASVLHSVATGNMLPTYRVVGDNIQSIPVIAVDAVEFAVNKLVDRGTSQANGVVANATDFLFRLKEELAK